MRSGNAPERGTRARPSLRRRRAAPLLCALLLPLLTGCLYGFAGGGLPRHIRTMAVLPFENDTPVPEVQREVFEQLRETLQDRLNLRDAPEARADLLVTGVISRYEVDLPVGVNADPRQATTARRKLQLVVEVQMVDQSEIGGGRELYKLTITREAQYAEGQELEGRRQAIEQLANEIVDKAQSNW